MRFKKGDIVESKQGYGRIVFLLTSDARWDYYLKPSGIYSLEKAWWASGRHLEGPYKGTYVHTFHLEKCSILNSFGLTKEIKEFKL